MSDHSTFLAPELCEYLLKLSYKPDAFLDSLNEAAQKADIPPIRIAKEQGAFIQVLLRCTNAKKVLEIGTLAGYSAIVMARALPTDAHLLTVEYSKKHADFAQEWVRKSNCSNKIQVLNQSGLDAFKSLSDNSFDAIFIDADKQNYMNYVNESKRVLKRGGLLMVDNAFAFGEILDTNSIDKSVKAIQAFNQWFAQQEAFEKTIAPIGDGMWLAYKN